MLLRDRRISPPIEAALADTPVVVINGARQVGKTTLANSMRLRGHTEYVTLDEAAQRSAAGFDPRSFVERSADTLVVDEVQLEPALFRAIKASVDRDRRPGRFLLTGSSRLLTAPDMADALVGRAEIIELWPFTQGELDHGTDTFVDAVFQNPVALAQPSAETRSGYMARIARGGFPEAVARTGARRSAWFEAYATTVVQRVVGEIADIERHAEIPRILRLCATRTATELNVRSLSRDLGIPARTLDAYLAHLANVFLIQLVPAWSTNLSSKVVRRPKLLLADTGLACHLVGARLDRGAGTEPGSLGPLVETFVGGEIRRQLTWSEERPSLWHFRDRGGREVDYVLEHPDGRVVGVEVKSSATVGSRDFGGLRFLEERLGDRFQHGVVLYLGPDAIPFGARLSALPLASLWTAPRA
jgi:predicted AAA+ superfamily ATPase